MKKLLFVHVPKAAGVHLSEYMITHLHFSLLASEKENEKGIWIDFTIPEILEYLEQGEGLLRTHTLAFGWSELAYSIPTVTEDDIIGTLVKFKEHGWFTFTFVRHPGELLCSFYHYVMGYYNQGARGIVEAHCPVADRTLDEFVAEYCEKELIPSYWELFDFIGESSDREFGRFFRQHFGHEFQPGASPSHASGSKGYVHYCETGDISEETQAKVEAAHSTRIYYEIVGKEI